MRPLPLARATRGAPALAAALAGVALVGCGEDEGRPIPSRAAGDIVSALDEVEQRVDSGACDDVRQESLPMLQQEIEELPAEVDEDVRSTLEDGLGRLEELVRAECVEPPEPEPTETIPEPTPEPEADPTPEPEPDPEPTVPDLPTVPDGGGDGGGSDGGTGDGGGDGGGGDGGGGGDEGGGDDGGGGDKGSLPSGDGDSGGTDPTGGGVDPGSTGDTGSGGSPRAAERTA